MVKRTVWNDTFQNDSFIAALDSDVWDWTDSDEAHALDCIFQQIYSMDNDKVMFHVQATNAGGGDASNVLHYKMLLLNRTSLDDDFLMVICSLHGHNATIKYLSEKILRTR